MAHHASSLLDKLLDDPRYKFSASDASFIFLHRTFRERERERAEIMNPSYLCGFCQTPLKTFDSKGTPSIEYTVWGNEEEEKKCPFFVKSSLLKDYCSVLLYRVKKIYKENPPYCQHGNTSPLFLSRSKKNFNRAFFKCANRADDDPCRYFQWADEEPNKYTLDLNHPRDGYFAQKPLLPPPPAKIAKRAKTSSNKKKETKPIEVAYFSLPVPVKRARQFKLKSRRSQRGTKKSRKRFHHHHHHHHHHRSPCCKKRTTKIPVHRVRPKTFKASNSCLRPPLFKQLLKKKKKKNSMLLENLCLCFYIDHSPW